MKTVKLENGLERVYNNVKLHAFGTNEYGNWASLSQDVVTKYPGKRMSNSLSDGFFEDEDIKDYSQTRYALIKVPENVTEEQMRILVEGDENNSPKFPDAVISRTLSYDVNKVITDEERWAINEGNTTEEAVVARKLVQDGEGNVYSDLIDGEKKEESEVIGLVEKDENGKTVDWTLTTEGAEPMFKVDTFHQSFKEDKNLCVVKAEKAQEITA